MRHQQIASMIEAIIARHDLLDHPFYRAWASGKLTRKDLRRYAQEYYHHVAAFPTYLSALHSRLPDGEMRRSVLRNLCEEEISGLAHSELWLDFAEGMGANREQVRNTAPSESTQYLMRTFSRIASESSPSAAFGAFYAYESQVARIAGTKAHGLREHYGADPKTCAYFVLHSTLDVHHARVWAEEIDKGVGQEGSSSSAEEVFATVEDAAAALWKSLDGIHEAETN